MITGSILTAFFFLIILSVISSSPTSMKYSTEEDVTIATTTTPENENVPSPFCITSNETNIIIPDKNDLLKSDKLMFYIFDGLISLTIGMALSMIIWKIMFIFFEDEIRLYGIPKGILKAIQLEIVTANEFAHREAYKTLYMMNNNNKASKTINKQYVSSAVFVTQAKK